MRAGSILLVLVTAVVTAAVTSTVWIFLYNRAGHAPEAVVTKAAQADVRQTVAAPPRQIAAGMITSAPAPAMIVPVEGVAPTALTDTWTQARDGGARTHDAIDIMAPRGTRVVAAAAGEVEKIHESVPGGHTVYVRTLDGGWVHYYAHLDGYAPGLTEGMKIGQGQLIGFVGSTGNADPTAPHLHFAVNRMGAGEKWYQGTPVNPYPLLMSGR